MKTEERIESKKILDKMIDYVFGQKKYIPEPIPELPLLKDGQCVYHSRFGKGFIISIQHDKCKVLFKCGTKELLSRFAKFKSD